MESELHKMAVDLLTAVWRGVSAAYKSRYRSSIWRQFEDNVRSAAYTSNLGKFISSLCAKLCAQIDAKSVPVVEGILNSGKDRELLKLIREETTLVVLMVRLVNQERRKEWEAMNSWEEDENAFLPSFTDSEE